MKRKTRQDVSYRSPGRSRPTLTQDSGQRTLQEYEALICRELSKASLPPLTLAFGVADLGPTITIADLRSTRGPTVFAVATALHVALNSVREPYPLVPTNENPFRTNPALGCKAALEAEGVVPDDFARATAPEAQCTPEEHKSAIQRYVTELLCENSAYQAEIPYRLANTLVLLGLKPFKGLCASPDRADSLFRQYVGLSAYEYVLTLFGLWSVGLKSSLLDTRTLLRDGERRAELIGPVTSVITELSLQFDEYRTFERLPPAKSYTGKARACAFFSRWPLIRLNEHQYMVAAHPFLKVQLLHKSLTKALALARTAEGRASTSFSQHLGARLEGFFSELCELWRPGDHFSEYQYLTGGKEKSPDRIVFERHGSKSVACLFQLKLKMLSEATHFGITDESVRKDLASAFSETIYKTIGFLARAEAAAQAGQLRKDTEVLTRRILSCERFCLIGVVPDLPAIFTFQDLRQILLDEVVSHLDATERTWFEAHFRSKCVWHVMDLDEFEWFLSIPTRERNLYKRLTGYSRDADLDGAFIKNGALPSNFRTYLIRKYGRFDARINDRRLTARIPELFALYEEMVSDVKSYFFVNRKPVAVAETSSLIDRK